jgi:hypothetical protein
MEKKKQGQQQQGQHGRQQQAGQGRQGQMGERHEPRDQRQQGQQGQQNEGEGNKTAARRYNQDQQEFAKSGQVERAAERAKRAVEGGEHDELEKAEDEGRSHARHADEDHDYDKDSKKT